MSTSPDLPPRIVTIGVYGFSEEAFFRALNDAGVGTFCDLRFRRGMRGSTYAFANSARLQRCLGEMGINYLHVKELAPDPATRDLQNQEDKRARVAKRARTTLGQAFIDRYRSDRLASFDSSQFVASMGPDPGVLCLFCVEGDPAACHRSLVAEKLATDLGLRVEHIRP
jgi:uncharacterized protein (DUF488 family)